MGAWRSLNDYLIHCSLSRPFSSCRMGESLIHCHCSSEELKRFSVFSYFPEELKTWWRHTQLYCWATIPWHRNGSSKPFLYILSQWNCKGIALIAFVALWICLLPQNSWVLWTYLPCGFSFSESRWLYTALVCSLSKQAAAGDALCYTVGLNVGFNDKLCHTHMLFFCKKTFLNALSRGWP